MRTYVMQHMYVRMVQTALVHVVAPPLKLVVWPFALSLPPCDVRWHASASPHPEGGAAAAMQ